MATSQIGNNFTRVLSIFGFTSVWEPVQFFFVLQLWLRLGSIILTLIFLFSSLVSVTGSYTEDEPNILKNFPRFKFR